MSKIGSVVFGFVRLSRRRSYGVYATAVKVEQASAAAVATAKTDVAAAPADASANKQDKLFWMRDPKTGCWIPENRFKEVDLRNRLIRHK